MRESGWHNDPYLQLAAGSAAQTNPLAASLLETLDDPRFRTLRDAVLEDMHLYPGAVALDLGCGPGMLLEGIVERVGAETRVHGLDLNPHFIAVARRRAEMLSFANATFTVGDCLRMPFEDQTFDAIAAERLLMHVTSIPDALSEVRRVLTVGGRVVFCDYDPFSAFAAGPDPTITARVMASAAHIYASPRAARETARKCVDAGLYVEKVHGQLLVIEDPRARTANGIAVVWAEHAILGRQAPPDTITRWRKAVDRSMSDGTFLISIPHIITIARRIS
jgi:ubiquinone/menaquinone biosynthesis C-methylase UbiE